MYEDKTLICKDCGNEFIFTAGEQKFFAEKGFTNDPLRCTGCRRAKKESMRRGRPLYEIVCAECGRVDNVPFEPTNDKPVYCNECFMKRRMY